VKKASTIALIFLMGASVPLFCQVEPTYGFIGFDTGYDQLIDGARSEGYQVKEEEILSVYGSAHVLLEKDLEFYSEDVSLFFDNNRALIFFSIRYTLHENQSRTIMTRLTQSIAEKLTEKYGENERTTVPYYRVYENKFEIRLLPPAPASEITRLSFKHLERYETYLEFYDLEVKRLEDEQIEKTVENL
jgi:hypothetical protein